MQERRNAPGVLLLPRFGQSALGVPRLATPLILRRRFLRVWSVTEVLMAHPLTASCAPIVEESLPASRPGHCSTTFHLPRFRDDRSKSPSSAPCQNGRPTTKRRRTVRSLECCPIPPAHA